MAKSGTKAQPAAAAPAAERQKPAHKVRLGRIHGTVWENHHAEQGPWYSVSFTRSYKDGQGQWQSATTFGRDDLLLVAKVADMIHTWIHQQQQQAGQSQEQGGSGDDIPL
jgi:hypothetical protein